MIVGRGGDDRIDGRGGNDLICGGPGADRLLGGTGNDRLLGGTDAIKFDRGGSYKVGDTLMGEAGDDWLDTGYDGRHTSQGPVGPDTVNYRSAPRGVHVDLAAGTATGWGTDHIVVVEHMWVTGSLHADVLEGSTGKDEMAGLGGKDRLEGRGGNDQLYPGAGNDIVNGGTGRDTVYDYGGRDTIHGDGGKDTLVAYGDDPAKLYGDAGDDDLTVILPRSSGAVLDGGAGENALTVYDGFPGRQQRLVVIDRAAGTITAHLATPQTSTIANIDDFSLAGEDIRYRYVGTDDADTVTWYGGGRIVARTFGGNDRVIGSPYADYLDLGAGNDYVSGSNRATCLDFERGSC